jgi:colanic acid/amylovoran biosynthesis protein
MSKVCLLGAPLETSNMGVSALAFSFFKIIRDIDKNPECCLLVGRSAPCSETIDIGSHTLQLNVINYRMSPRSSLQEHILWILVLAFVYRIIPNRWLRSRILKANTWLKNVSEADFIGDIHGGDGFSDIYGLSSLIGGLLPDLSVLLMGKELVLLPQTYGPYSHPIAKWCSRIILERSSKILSRDSHGIKTVQQLLGQKYRPKSVFFCPDVAFLLDCKMPEFYKIIPTIQKNTDMPLIGLNISGLLFNGGLTRNNMFGLRFDYKRFIEKSVRFFLETTSAHILLIPHTYAYPGNVESDPDACEFIQKGFGGDFPGRIHLLSGQYNPVEIKGIVSLCDFFIGSRMHSCIASLSQGIPTVGIAYSKKFMGVFESIDAGGLVIDARKVDMQTAMEDLVRHFKTRASIRPILKARVEEVRREVRAVFDAMVGGEGYPV